MINLHALLASLDERASDRDKTAWLVERGINHDDFRGFLRYMEDTLDRIILEHPDLPSSPALTAALGVMFEVGWEAHRQSTLVSA